MTTEIPARVTNTVQRLKINEIFYSIQGESSYAGRRCVLVRLTGCQMRCRWCDTPYSFYEGEWMSLEEIEAEVGRFHCPLVELTGGEPLLQPAALPLMEGLCDSGYEVLLETGGGLDMSRVDRRVHRILDVKCPASGEAENNYWPNLDCLADRDEVKFVIADRADYEWARKLTIGRDLATTCPVHFSPVHGEVSAEDLSSWVLEDELPVRIQVQLHKAIFGVERRGV